MEVYQFIDHCKSEHMTLNDLQKMKAGDVIDVVIWDFNFEEGFIWSSSVEMQYYEPTEFFKDNHHKIKYLGNMTWEIHFCCGTTITREVEIERPNEGFVTTQMDNTEIYDSGGYTSNGWVEQQKLNCQPNDRVGWSGPIMLWERLNGKPKVYWDKSVLD